MVLIRPSLPPPPLRVSVVKKNKKPVASFYAVGQGQSFDFRNTRDCPVPLDCVEEDDDQVQHDGPFAVESSSPLRAALVASALPPACLDSAGGEPISSSCPEQIGHDAFVFKQEEEERTAILASVVVAPNTENFGVLPLVASVADSFIEATVCVSPPLPSNRPQSPCVDDACFRFDFSNGTQSDKMVGVVSLWDVNPAILSSFQSPDAIPNSYLSFQRFKLVVLKKRPCSLGALRLLVPYLRRGSFR